MLAGQSWGIQLWDQTSNLIKYQETGINLHEKLQKFVLDIAKLQGESFLAQKRVCERALLNVKKVIGLESTYGQGYNAFVHAIGKLIDTENLIPVSFFLQANGETRQSLEEEKKSLKQWKHDRNRFQAEAKNQAKIIDDESKRFHEKYRDVVRSKVEFIRVDEDNTCSKLDVEKALSIYAQKYTDFKKARSDYSAALDQFNLHRRFHYSTTLRNWGERGQSMEEFRVAKTKAMIAFLVERLRVMMDRLLSVCSDLEAAAATMDAEKDCAALIERLRTGNDPPGDVPMVNLDVSEPPVTPGQLPPSGLGGDRIAAINHRSGNSLSYTGSGCGDSGSVYYASIPVSPSSGAPTSEGEAGGPFTTADTVVEPTGFRRMPVVSSNSDHPTSSRSGRRISVGGIGLASNSGNTSGHSSFLWKVFTRRSKSKDPDRQLQGVTHGSKMVSRSQSNCETAAKKAGTGLHPIHCNEVSKSLSVEEQFESGVLGSSISAESDGSAEATTPTKQLVPVLAPRSAPLFKTVESSQEMAQMLANGEFSRSFSSPSTSSSGDTFRRTSKNTDLKVSRPNSHTGSPKSHSPLSMNPKNVFLHSCSPATNANNYCSLTRTPKASSSTHLSVRTTALDHPKVELASRRLSNSPRHHSTNHTVKQKHLSGSGNCKYYPPSRQSEESLPHKSNGSDLIAVGTCKALYDFESSQYGDTFLSFKSGDEFKVVSSGARWRGSLDADGWIYAETVPPRAHGLILPRRGFIPAAFVEISLYPEPIPLSQTLKPGNFQVTSHRRNHIGPRNVGSLQTLGQATEL